MKPQKWLLVAAAMFVLLENPAFCSPTMAVFDFREAPLSEVLRVFTETTGSNVVSSPEIQDMKVSLFLEEVKPRQALEVLCKNYNLWYVDEGRVIRIMKVEEYGRELMLRRDEETRVLNLKYASCLSLAEMIAGVFGERIQYTPPETTESYGHVGTDALPEIGAELDVSEARSSAARRGKRSAGDASIDAGGISLEEQDLVRMRELAASRGKVSAGDLVEYQVGQAFVSLTVFPRNNAIVIRSVDRILLDDIAELIHELDTPTREVLLECHVLEVALNDGFDSFFNLSFTPGADLKVTRDGEGGKTGEIIRDVAGGITGIDLTNAASLADSTAKLMLIDRSVQASMELLEKEGRLHKVASPVMLCANNAAARFFQGSKTPVRKGYSVVEARTNSNGDITSPATVKTDYKEEELGFSLEITPSINKDGTITLKIVTELGEVDKGAGPEFNYVINGKPQVGKTDTIETTRIEDIIVGMDRQTLALGGLVREEDGSDLRKVPFFGDVPLLGYLFRDKSTASRRTEIIFCITPHIIMSPDAGHAVNQDLLRQLSDHPYIVSGEKRLLRHDPATDDLEHPAKPAPRRGADLFRGH